MARTRSSRRGALRRIGLAAAGLAGFSVAGAGVAQAASSRSPAAQEPFRLVGRGWQVHSNTARRGVLPVRGERVSSYGELFAPGRDIKLGEFYGNLVALASPFPGVFDAGTLELHSFVLDGGSLFGIGNTLPDGRPEDVFAIVGGTGRFAGARGSYVAVQKHLGLGGDGSAEFVFTLA